jgi:hypothetical protein
MISLAILGLVIARAANTSRKRLEPLGAFHPFGTMPPP